MLTKEDVEQIKTKGISEEQIAAQLASFSKGFDFLDVKASASVGNGIKVVSKEEQLRCIDTWEAYLKKDHTIVKFVPASGAASRMFKDLFAFLEAAYSSPQTEEEKQFFDGIEKFAFYEELNKYCRMHHEKDIPELMEAGDYKAIVSVLLFEPGLNYSSLPKGLLLFHTYSHYARTAMEEHLAEGAMYAKNSQGDVNLHFTVSADHQALFEKIVREKKGKYEDKFSVEYHVSFSRQLPSTDTIAADMDDRPFRDAGGRLVFRPGGHGALIRNLDAIDADVIFIKNIDNVVPDGFKYATVIYKKILGGILVRLQEKIHQYLGLIDSGKYTHKQVEEMIHFLHDELCTRNPDTKFLEDAELVLYLRRKFHRPLRVCGMVRNEGEPGGGPFLAVNPDGTVSPQILESSQLDLGNPTVKEMFAKGTHFNPVDIVCAVRDHTGEKFHLPDFIDSETAFISRKSKDGKVLKALELPGLWNGAMSDWNTVFVEVPIATFNPVKTVNDLLRPEHQ